MALFKKILIPTDGSEYTKAAVRKGLEMAKATGGFNPGDMLGGLKIPGLS